MDTMRAVRLFALTLVSLLALSACSDRTGEKTSDELIARVQDTSRDAGTRILSGTGGWTGGSRCDAAWYLGYRKATAAVDALIPLLRDGQMDQCVVDALGEMGDNRAVGPLLDAMADSSGRECGLDDASYCVRSVWVTKALVQMGEPAVEQLIAVVEAANWGAGAEARDIVKAD